MYRFHAFWMSTFGSNTVEGAFLRYYEKNTMLAAQSTAVWHGWALRFMTVLGLYNVRGLPPEIPSIKVVFKVDGN